MKNIFNLFKSKNEIIPPQDSEEVWTVIHREEDGLVIRVNTAFKKSKEISRFPVKLGIAILIETHDKVIEKLKYDIEDYINDYFNKNGAGYLVAAISGLKDGNLFIEFLSYVNNKKMDIPSFHRLLIEKYSGYEVQMYAKQDGTWESYTNLMS